jgi:hypothetical protein
MAKDDFSEKTSKDSGRGTDKEEENFRRVV